MKLRKTAVVLGIVGLFMAVVAPPAAASHSLSMTHQPPPRAVERQDLHLVVGVNEACWFFCSEITLVLRYQSLDGKMRIISKQLENFPPHQAVALVIPGKDVQGSLVTYSIRAQQDKCDMFGSNCHTASVRTPTSGMHQVPISRLLGKRAP